MNTRLISDIVDIIFGFLDINTIVDVHLALDMQLKPKLLRKYRSSKNRCNSCNILFSSLSKHYIDDFFCNELERINICSSCEMYMCCYCSETCYLRNCGAILCKECKKNSKCVYDIDPKGYFNGGPVFNRFISDSCRRTYFIETSKGKLECKIRHEDQQ